MWPVLFDAALSSSTSARHLRGLAATRLETARSRKVAAIARLLYGQQLKRPNFSNGSAVTVCLHWEQSLAGHHRRVAGRPRHPDTGECQVPRHNGQWPEELVNVRFGRPPTFAGQIRVTATSLKRSFKWLSVSNCFWPGPGFRGGRRKLTLASRAIASIVNFLAPPRTHTGRQLPSSDRPEIASPTTGSKVQPT